MHSSFLSSSFRRNKFIELIIDREFAVKLLDTLAIINVTQYFDAICDILLYRFDYLCPYTEELDESNEELMYFLDLLATHNSGAAFIQTIIHLLNRRGGEGVRTIN